MIKILMNYIGTFFKEILSILFGKGQLLTGKDIRHRYHNIKSVIQNFTIIVLLLLTLLLGGYYVKTRVVVEDSDIEVKYLKKDGIR